MNTNAIAERAGISVGTLYEYFPNKEAVLIAMARRQLADDQQVIGKVLAEAFGRPGAPLVRLVIRTLVKLHQTRPEVRRAIMAAHISSGFGGEHARPVQEVAELLASRGDRMLPERAQPIPPAALFVLTRAVIGVLRAAFDERSILLGTPELEDELAALVEASLDRLRAASS